MTGSELFEPSEYLQEQGRPGYFSILAKPSGQARQESYELQYLPAVVKALNPFIDTWITQAVFRGPNRRAVNLRDVGLLFADLDTYRAEGLRGKTPEEQVALLCLFCGQEGIPAPSIVLYSGRGLQAKWLLTGALGPVSLFEWNQAQLALVRLLEPFAADMAARDVSRVLRVDRTVNTKSGERVRVVYVTGGIEDCPARYDFEDLRALLVRGQTETAPREERKQTKDRPALALPHELNLRRLNWFRLYDLRDLWALRGGVREGSRELTLFWELCFLLRAEPGKVSDLWSEAETLAAQIDSSDKDFYKRSDLSTLYRKAQEARNGQVVAFKLSGVLPSARIAGGGANPVVRYAPLYGLDIATAPCDPKGTPNVDYYGDSTTGCNAAGVGAPYPGCAGSSYTATDYTQSVIWTNGGQCGG